MDSFTEVVLPDHLTICNQLYIMSTARDRGWKEQWFKKIHSILPTYIEEGHQKALWAVMTALRV